MKLSLATAFFAHLHAPLLLATMTHGHRLGESRDEHAPKDDLETHLVAGVNQFSNSRSLLPSGDCEIIIFGDELQRCYQDHCDSSSVFYGLSKDECNEYVGDLIGKQCFLLVTCQCYENCVPGSYFDIMKCMTSTMDELLDLSDKFSYDDSCAPEIEDEDDQIIKVQFSNGADIGNNGVVDFTDDWTASITISLNTIPDEGYRNAAGALLISGDDASSFAVSPASYSIDELWKEPTGKAITVTYNPNNPGKHSASLTSRIESEGMDPISVFELSLVASYITPTLDGQSKGLVYCNRCENELDFQTPDVGSAFLPSMDFTTTSGRGGRDYPDVKHYKGLRVFLREKSGGRISKAAIIPFSANKPDMAHGSVSFWASVDGGWRGHGTNTHIHSWVKFFLTPQTHVRIVGHPNYHPIPPTIEFTADGNVIKAAQPGNGPLFVFHIGLRWIPIEGFGTYLELWVNGDLFTSASTTETFEHINDYVQNFEVICQNTKGGDRTPSGDYAKIDTIKIWNKQVDLRQEWNGGAGVPMCKDL